ncbi:MAG: hypothetical protein H6819_12895 [Phycisphaerales bacterium]|nr:hypothetical protein [Phycisphaerales bacterium]MCB9857794.1 hypothetical protein [Phycisphaerales bacterium]MCB9863854.1 hypothetical protein [Phycisphaerales bacterium]
MRGNASILKCLAVIVISASSLAMADTIVGTTSGKVYHNHPDECGSAKRIQPDNITRFASKEEAERAGRRQCRSCAKLDAKAAESRPRDDASQQGSRRGEDSSARGVAPVGPVRTASDRSVVSPSISRLPQLAHVTRVIDGGTLELDTHDKACLLGVIVPMRGQPAARDAQRFIKEQTRDRLMKLSAPEPLNDPIGRDALGRWRVSIAPEGGRDLAGELLFHGYAWLDRDRLTARTAEYARLEETAWSARRGIWRQLEGEAGQRIVATGRGATAYHDAKCEHVPHLTDPMQLTINEARARRLVPCSEYHAKGDEKSGQE